MKYPIFFIFLVSLVAVSHARRVATIQNNCDNILSVPHTGPGCGIPDYVDPETFGDNNNTRGTLRITPRRSGLTLSIKLVDLPKPDLVLTAWLAWADPNDPKKPSIFKVAADYVSPCAPFTAGFTSGLGREPNELRYVGPTTATLKVRLNFNPTYRNEGALMRMEPCVQKDVPGIQDTEARQYQLSGSDGLYSPSTSSFLRRYDPDTGFEILRPDGRPEVVRSPTRAITIIVASHIDRTTHGITPGRVTFDHYDLMAFPLDKVTIGKPTMLRKKKLPGQSEDMS